MIVGVLQPQKLKKGRDRRYSKCLICANGVQVRDLKRQDMLQSLGPFMAIQKLPRRFLLLSLCVEWQAEPALGPTPWDNPSPRDSIWSREHREHEQTFIYRGGGVLDHFLHLENSIHHAADDDEQYHETHKKNHQFLQSQVSAHGEAGRPSCTLSGLRRIKIVQINPF